MAQRVHLSLSLSVSFFLTLSLSLPPLLILSVSASHVSTDHCFMLPSPPCSPAKRESPSRHHHCQRDGPRTQIGRDTQREGGEGRGREEGGGGKKMYLLPSSYPTVLPLSVFFLNRKAYSCRVVGKRRALTSSLWHTMTHGKDIWGGIRPQYSDLCNHPLVHSYYRLPLFIIYLITQLYPFSHSYFCPHQSWSQIQMCFILRYYFNVFNINIKNKQWCRKYWLDFLWLEKLQCFAM